MSDLEAIRREMAARLRSEPPVRLALLDRGFIDQFVDMRWLTVSQQRRIRHLLVKAYVACQTPNEQRLVIVLWLVFGMGNPITGADR